MGRWWVSFYTTSFEVDRRGVDMYDMLPLKLMCPTVALMALGIITHSQTGDELRFFRTMVGSTGEQQLRVHRITIQRETYKVGPYLLL